VKLKSNKDFSYKKWNAYPLYKESGLAWPGKIPEHWDLLRLRHACKKITDGSHYSPAAVIDGRPYVTVRDLVSGKVNVDDAARISDDEFYSLERNGCRPRVGDVLFSKDGTVGKVALVERSDFVVLSSLAILQPGPYIQSSFLFQYLSSAPGTSQIESKFAGAALRRITLDVIVDLIAVVPPLKEQCLIAAFLDRETAKIDRLVSEKEKLIELLQEKRVATITQAVTKGLDPNVPMKDSGVEWLGEIPSHWEIKRLKYILAAPLKYGANEPAELNDLDLPRYIRITDIDESNGLRDDTFKSLPAEVAKEYILHEGDLLFARSGATTGKTFLYRKSWGTCAYAGYLIRARLDKNKAHPKFIRYFTASLNYWEWLRSTLIQATIQNVSAERYSSLYLPLPTVVEQYTTAVFLDRETAKIDALIGKIQKGIALLKEYRSALISAAVTGKIDVRGEI
jgi:type I restriction enzyme S subunit